MIRDVIIIIIIIIIIIETARGDRVRRPGRPCPGACALPGGR
jgi:hypothetical protein